MQKITNVIPVLAKGDSYTQEELKIVKKDIVDSAKEFGVSFFDVVSTIDDIQDDEERELIRRECLTEHCLAPCPPFAVINPSQIRISKQKDGEAGMTKRLGRNYGWAFVDSLDPKNSDFTRLHKLILKYVRTELISTMEQKYKKYEEQQKEEELASNSQSSICHNQYKLGLYACIGVGILGSVMHGINFLKKWFHQITKLIYVIIWHLFIIFIVFIIFICLFMIPIP